MTDHPHPGAMPGVDWPPPKPAAPPGSMIVTPGLAGYCPMGCGQTLIVGDGGHITCSRLNCPRPTAVADLLEDQETEHIVQFGPRTFTVRHPLRERLDDALMTCGLHDHIRGLDGPPVRPGRYRARLAGGGWTWEEL